MDRAVKAADQFFKRFLGADALFGQRPSERGGHVVGARVTDGSVGDARQVVGRGTGGQIDDAFQLRGVGTAHS